MHCLSCLSNSSSYTYTLLGYTLTQMVALDVHGCQRQNLGPLHLLQLGGDDTADSGADGLAGLVDEDAGVVVELDDATVWALPLLCGAHDDSVPDVSAADLVGGADGDAVARLGAKVALLLDNNDYAVACSVLTTVLRGFASVRRRRRHDIPTLAGRFDRRTLTHSTMAAPELSMQLTRVYGLRISNRPERAGGGWRRTLS
jgi:hypothetical protein